MLALRQIDQVFALNCLLAYLADVIIVYYLNGIFNFHVGIS